MVGGRRGREEGRKKGDREKEKAKEMNKRGIRETREVRKKRGMR